MGYYINKVRQRVEEELEVIGRKYNDEVTKYLITSELVAKTNSEIRLVNDITYLLKKIELLEYAYRDEIIALKNKYDYRFMNMNQTTIDDHFNEKTAMTGVK